MTLEEDSFMDDEDDFLLDELSTDEEDSDTLEELFSDEDDSATTSEELLSAAFSLNEDFSPLSLLLDSTLPELDEDFSPLEELTSITFSLDEDSLSLLDVNNKADPSLLSTTSLEVLDVISSMGLVEDSVSPPHPTNDMHVAPASRQRMIVLKAEKRLGRERWIWVVILLILNKLLFLL